MKADSPAKGADRYVVGKVERFDQKNEMLKRANWDPVQLDMGQRFYIEKKDFAELLRRNRPGFTLQDAAFVDAAWRLETDFAKGNRGGKQGLYAWETTEPGWTRRPTGVKLPVDDPAKMTSNIKRVSTFFGASLVGVCELDRRWVYSHYFDVFDRMHPEHAPLEIPEEYKYAIAIAIEMDYEALKSSPAQPAEAATGLGYSKMAFTANLVAQFIRGLGYRAIPSGNDTACNIPIAIDAGLGELSRMGLLIAPETGPRIRLCKVLTDLPLVPDKPIEFGVWDFCLKCEKCAQHCPSRAIMHGEPTQEIHNISNREGLFRWPVNAEKCLRFWVANGSSCSNCIRVCPFNKPSGWLHSAVRWGVKNTRWMDRLFVKMDDWLGYGKQVSPGRYWEQ
ncbi:MAG: reductive dehalogenase [Dehalococcoidia bacterium]|nr:3-chloro-4-hydroxyphenylacetate reductive dehalogenase [Chloroflexota bacterium]MBT9161839.1 3-chloro-4-hydroxyphenylacetate reductive dehalogenase [Chloroflexota bacterium]